MEVNRYLLSPILYCVPKDLYDLDFRTSKQKLQLYFRKNHYRISKHIARFGKKHNCDLSS
jgi:hypothetical protein